jgi:hypothetical protein
MSPLLCQCVLGWLLCNIVNQQLSKAMMYFFIIFLLVGLPHQTKRLCPPTGSITFSSLLKFPHHQRHQLLVGCCVLQLIGSHLRPKPHPYLFILMCLVCTPPTRKPITPSAKEKMSVLWRHVGSYGIKILGHRCHTHGERAMLLDRVAVAAHFDCCVMLCVVVCCCVFLCVLVCCCV